MREKTVIYHDPLQARESLNSILRSLFQFLRSELMFHENRLLDKTTWGEIKYKSSPPGKPLPREQSGVAISQRAYSLCTGKPAPPALREKMLQSLRKHCDALWS